MEQLKTIGRELAIGSQGGFGQSKEFLDLVKSIGEARSKAEEDRIVLSEIETLKRRIVEPDIPKRKMKEFIIRLVYFEMLGHDASFGYIHAVKMTHDDSLLLKRTGYLAVTLFLNEDHDLIILIVNTIQKDLKSDNYLVVCAALNAVCKLINEETIPAVLPQVVELLGHSKETVRKKAIMALHRFYQKSPSSVFHLVSNFSKRLCDNDPGVMGATLCPLFDLITIDVNSCKDLVISFVNILKQIAEHRLPKSYDYHQMPAPFIQIKLLKILALLGSGDKQASEQMYTVVGDIFRKCDSSSNIGNAVLYECISCVSSIYPNFKLLEAAADVIAKFLKSDSHNLKYMGIDALGRLIKLSPEVAEQHQLAVIDCLEDPDDTLKRKTFELLYKMTKSSNVEVIADCMIDYLININDNHYKAEIASRCVELAEQFAPSNHWFIQTMNRVFEHAGDLVKNKVAHNLMRLIAEGFGEDDDTADSQLRSSAVESYLRIIGEPKLPSIFLQVICWVLGEYGTTDGKFSASYVTGKLCDVADAYSNDETVKCQSLIEELSASHSTDLQQRAYELQEVIGLDAHAVECIMPLDASCEDIEIDKNLSFLNEYVQQSIEKGAQPYIPESERSGMLDISTFQNQNQHELSTHGLRFEAYELPKPSVPSSTPPLSLSSTTELVPVPERSYESEVQQTATVPSSSDGGLGFKLRLDGVQKKWGRATYSSSATSTNSGSQSTLNGVTHIDVASNVNSKAREASYDSRKTQVEISPEKQKLAASLFGGSSNSEKRVTSTGHKVAKGSSHVSKSTVVPTTDVAVEKTPPVQPPPDLLDLGEPTVKSGPSSVDPFMQLEGLLEPAQLSSNANPGLVVSTSAPDIMQLYADTLASGQSGSGFMYPLSSNRSDDNLVSGLANAATDPAHSLATATQPAQFSKGPNPKDSLEKDALVRQMGVTPLSQNPNLFKDLLG
ncbi:AP-4 complex subunit epsilon isoform X2 [Hevea brasiliensis]|uniref:AP-4 complex subunit epsilon isoform X2 n=1 Tax=Hevea brasiliensis TaxID=3981 RepID=UPI0025D6631F|nr:AP-4 complex subunit epsilon isoform X2 [Hevea brasiliensis]